MSVISILWVLFGALALMIINMGHGKRKLNHTDLEPEDGGRLEGHLEFLFYGAAFFCVVLLGVIATNEQGSWTVILFAAVDAIVAVLLINWWVRFYQSLRFYQDKYGPNVTPSSISTGSSRS